MAVYNQPWVWVLVVGVLLTAIGVFLLILTDENQTLWIIATVLGVLVAIAGGIYGAVRRKPEKAVAVEEQDLLTRKQFTESFGESLGNFNRETSQRVDAYTEGKFKDRFGKFSESSGRLAAAPLSSMARTLKY